MTGNRKDTWVFRARFRRCAFGWKSQPAIGRIREAVSEIKKVARKEPLRAAEGAVLFLEKVSPAIEQVDGSSGAIGTAVDRAIDALVPILASAPAEDEERGAWLERLWTAYENDRIPYLESLGDHWGALCVSPDVASRWADRLIGTCRSVWNSEPGAGEFFPGTTNCLSALLAAGRHAEILELLALAPHPFWDYDRYGVLALAAMGKPDEAIRYAEEKREIDFGGTDFARVCEEVLLSAGRIEEAYRRFGLVACEAQTYVSWFRAVSKKYPHKEPRTILEDLVARAPGSEGKWFAAAKDAGFFDLAIELANRTPCAPQTLTRAARDYALERPEFAVEAGLAALRWLVEGYGYEITGGDVHDAYHYTLQAAENAGCVAETRERAIALIASERAGARFVTKILGRELGNLRK